MIKKHLPIVGIIIALCLFYVAASNYPGGTSENANTVGYDWAQNFISTLFAPTALNGEANPARTFSIPAMLLICFCLGFIFKQIANNTQSNLHRKRIEIGGIGAAVYGFLVVTPMHDLMLNIGLLFGLIALLAILHRLCLQSSWYLFAAGLVSIGWLLLATVMYYTTTFYTWLPILQKVSLLACLMWVLMVYYAEFNQEEKHV